MSMSALNMVGACGNGSSGTSGASAANRRGSHDVSGGMGSAGVGMGMLYQNDAAAEAYYSAL
jgi:hypothetical protein